MSSHNYSVFKNSCIKTPVNPINKHPLTSYERIKSVNTTNRSEFNKPYNNTNSEITSVSHKSSSSQRDNNNGAFMSLVDFYESIPEYGDINHLSEKEFYNKLETLKLKQKELKNNCFTEKFIDKNYENDKKLTKNDEKYFKNINKTTAKFYENSKLRELYSKTPVRFTLTDVDDELITENNWKKNLHNRKNSSKSVRINSGKSGDETFSLRSGTPYLMNFSDFDDEYFINKSKGNRSKSVSPNRQSTVPQPFKMTQREEEERMLEDLMVSSKCFSPKENVRPKSEDTQFKANAVPITSKIPLYKHIVAEQEHRNELAKLNSTIELQSQMRPFSFTEKIERPINSRCLSRSLSSPNLGGTPKTGRFKAKPCPKNLFSNYFYHKMWEDEYFRNLNRKIRAEELLKASKLPPSMSKRDNNNSQNRKINKNKNSQRPESGSSINNFNKKNKQRKRRHKKRVNQFYDKTNDYYLIQKQNHFITTSTIPFQFETDKRLTKRLLKQSSTGETSSITNSSLSSNMPSPPTPIYPVSRPNLAATLRTEFSRKKICEYQNEPEIVQPLRTHMNRIDWGVRKSPAWKSLYYDGTNDEDISLRLATRKAEQKLRQEEYNISMELMRQRVRNAPLLLEGQTHWSAKVGQMSHNCGKEAQEKLLKKTRKIRSGSFHNRNMMSKLSNYSDKSLRSLGSSKREGYIDESESIIDGDLL